MKNLKQLLGICEHKWVVNEKINVFDGGELPVATKIILRCEKCGKIKSKEV